MIVPMKKVSLFLLGEKKKEALKTLRALGLVHIEITEGSGERLASLVEKVSLLEGALFVLGKLKNVESKEATLAETLEIAGEIHALAEEKKACQAKMLAMRAELDRVKAWGESDPRDVEMLAEKGIVLCFYEMPRKEYEKLDAALTTVRVGTTRSTVRFLWHRTGVEGEEEMAAGLEGYRFDLPQSSTEEMRREIRETSDRIETITARIDALAVYAASLKRALEACGQEIEFETYATGMETQSLSDEGSLSVAYFKGYIEAENLEKLQETARENAWGLLIEEPNEEDNVPTKLKNNKFVSLIYPLTDFLGTVPGYFEYDISGWFLSFILIFFGIIFGDGGYGLLISAVAAIPIVKALLAKKPIAPAFLLIGLFGLSTVLWGTLTCTWFGLSPEQLPAWLKSLSIPVISNVYADTLWHPFWTSGSVGLTTAQNLQIFCFSLALVQLTVAHIKGALRNRRSLKILGDIGSILQLLGIYYLVLSLVVNAEVFSFGLVLGGIPVGTVAIALIGVGFVVSFAFSNYEGSVIKSVLSSLKNIVSVLLGVVNVFSDIVSYIRLWAVGLAGAAISATVNELAGPLLGSFMFMIVAIVLLVFGHGLNMILNVLSVIVHGIRLNTLEFSSHLDMSWSGHKFKPFQEKMDDKGETL
ncbi:MAG: ATPase [Ruminococcaceae bacterium]|nr:ATPase [Oscillospiraceae bacterium]